jgi:hypothetical protein
MSYNNEDMKKWKMEQIDYFRQYLKSFKNHTKEYNQIIEGIRELENSL